MNIRTRHIAMLLYGGLAAILLVTKPELVTTVQDALVLIGPFIAMFTWDKISAMRSGTDNSNVK